MLRRGAFGFFLYNDFQLSVQELRPQARFFKGLYLNVLTDMYYATASLLYAVENETYYY